MDLSAIIDSSLDFLGGVADTITGFFTTRTVVEGQTVMNRDNQLSETNRALSRNAMLGGTLPLVAIALVVLLLVMFKKK